MKRALVGKLRRYFDVYGVVLVFAFQSFVVALPIYSRTLISCIPLASLVIAAIIDAIWRRRYATGLERRLTEGHCLSCGYDLTGNVSGTCPECGGKVG